MPRFNLFQRLVRQWDRLHPYNAAQAVRLRIDPHLADAGRLRRTFADTLSGHALGRVSIRRHGFDHGPPTMDAPPDVVALDPAIEVAAHLTAELNRPFPAEGSPFRAFTRVEPDGSVWLGIVYHHWVADSASVRSVLRTWTERVADLPLSDAGPLPRYAGGYLRLFGPQASGWSVPAALATTLRDTARLRRSRRVERRDFSDLTARFEFHRGLPGLSRAVVTRARRAGVTVNDVFLAAIAQAVAPHLPAIRAGRPDLALGTIVDLRPAAGPLAPLDRAFGLFLGFTATTLRPADLIDPPATLAAIARQTAARDRRAAAADSLIRMPIALAFGAALSRGRVLQFYRKRVPLAAGISNINLNRTWAGSHHPRLVLEYLRASPTGPMLPIVFTPSTLGEHLSVGLTYRPAILDPATVATIARDFLAACQAPD